MMRDSDTRIEGKEKPSEIVNLRANHKRFMAPEIN